MQRRLTTGTSLIEILVVIVVLLVGILALVQVFPPGIAALRATGANLIAGALATAEIERQATKKGEMPEYIATGRHIPTLTGLAFIVDASRPTRDLMPPRDPITGIGRLNSTGNIVFDSGVLGDWTRVGGANKISRVFGESHTIAAPRAIPAGDPIIPNDDNYGSLVSLNFAPIYYFLLPAGVGEPGVLQVYGNEMTRKMGDQATAAPIPASFGEARDWEFYFVEAERSNPAGPFTDLDQVWFGPAETKDVRIALSFVYDTDPAPLIESLNQYDMVVSLSLDPFNPPPFASIEDNYWIISLPALVGQPDIYGRTLYNPANVRSVYRESVRMQRLFQEIPLGLAFDAINPYQYQVMNGAFGTLLVNPAAFNFTVKNEAGVSVPLRANADYTVYDWRILRDEFRVPPQPGEVKLVMGGLQPFDGFRADGRRNNGLGIVGPAMDPAGALDLRTDDFLLLDLSTGGIILGNIPGAGSNVTIKPPPPIAAAQGVGLLQAGGEVPGYYVDKSKGYIQFRDTVVGGGAVQVPVAYSTGNVVTPWLVVTEDISGHAVRALYMARGEWSVQVYRSAARYRITDIVAANGLQVSECYVGGSAEVVGIPIGDPRSLYFPLADLGQRVNIAEIYYRDTVAPFELHVLRDQNVMLEDVENINVVDHARADLQDRMGPNTAFDFTMGYAVRRVRGASMTVRVLHNDSMFSLAQDPQENYRRLEGWAENWRRHEAESYILGGDPQ